jgi:hypothetical protein
MVGRDEEAVMSSIGIAPRSGAQHEREQGTLDGGHPERGDGGRPSVTATTHTGEGRSSVAATTHTGGGRSPVTATTHTGEVDAPRRHRGWRAVRPQSLDVVARAGRRVAARTHDAGMATAEYAIATLAAVGFAGLLVVLLKSDVVRGLLTGIIKKALHA